MPGAPALGAVRMQVYRQLFTAVAEEMGAALRRASLSPNIRERRDYSCAVFDGAGRVVAMGDHMPVHLGAMPLSVAAALELEPGPGDVVALNDPFRGGTHLPDITVVKAVYVGGTESRARGGAARPLAYLAARAHHADVGGMAPGSMPLAREVFQEGLRIPPVRLVAGGEKQEDVWRIVLANVRTPEEREGDLAAQVAALVAGERRLAELVARRGEAEVVAAMAELRRYGE